MERLETVLNLVAVMNGLAGESMLRELLSFESSEESRAISYSLLRAFHMLVWSCPDKCFGSPQTKQEASQECWSCNHHRSGRQGTGYCSKHFLFRKSFWLSSDHRFWISFRWPLCPNELSFVLAFVTVKRFLFPVGVDIGRCWRGNRVGANSAGGCWCGPCGGHLFLLIFFPIVLAWRPCLNCSADLGKRQDFVISRTHTDVFGDWHWMDSWN